MCSGRRSDQASEGTRTMPSPFPGIDPYIESQGFWPDLHARLITCCCDNLNDQLPEPYEARIGEQIGLVESRELSAKTVYPDVAANEGGGAQGASSALGGILTLEP